MLDLMYTCFIKAILSASRDRWRQYIQHKMLIQCFENAKYKRARQLKKILCPVKTGKIETVIIKTKKQWYRWLKPSNKHLQKQTLNPGKELKKR